MSGEETQPRRLTRAETKARTRALLLDAAAQVFARKGFAGASVDDIAEEAGFTTGALYTHFSSKEEVFVEVFASRSRHRLVEAADIVSDADQSPDETRSAMSRLVVDVADNDVDFALLQAEFWLYAIRRPEFQQHLAGQFRSNRDALTAVLAARAEKRGQGGDAPFEELSTVLLALFQGLVQLRRTDPDLVPESLYGKASHWLFTGLAARS
ncbi:TetR/AcrR family transcriptional regulator [Amycolatopsis saalfeldensis]|uniref:DNA-binding transcriptional regulator, AcrR family n=1 Tax=Amycolatopsis saalfeldensis TaxID=394193 RepID=A0A1H8YFY5_9PSEU|nr:TetR/AcrR family transcriptional regulator [Amycolatopsis saalfeldensis]SEP51124.1 DNA-binding transcriptional regulator, AcrR family [Amycolatopsis saalfeldensis]